MAAWRKLSLNSAATRERERDKNAARSLGWNSQAHEYIDSEACESDDDFMRQLENEYSGEASETDMGHGCDNAGAALSVAEVPFTALVCVRVSQRIK